MNNTGEAIKIVIIGTKRSLALDLDEKNEIIFQPGETFCPGINSVEDLFGNMVQTAHMRGDRIESFLIGTHDVVEQYIKDELIENILDPDTTSQSLSADPIFANYDHADLFEKVSLIKMRLTDYHG
jgi:hypothetical protein